MWMCGQVTDGSGTLYATARALFVAPRWVPFTFLIFGLEACGKKFNYLEACSVIKRTYVRVGAGADAAADSGSEWGRVV